MPNADPSQEYPRSPQNIQHHQIEDIEAHSNPLNSAQTVGFADVPSSNPPRLCKVLSVSSDIRQALRHLAIVSKGMTSMIRTKNHHSIWVERECQQLLSVPTD